MARFTWPWSKSEQFTGERWDISDPAFAAWWYGGDEASESVNASSVLGVSAVLRAVSVISGTIAGLPLRTYERQGDERVRVPSVFDDPYPGIDGIIPFAWVETVLLHLLLWRKAFLWHEQRDARSGFVSAYRPISPEIFSKVERVNGRMEFSYTENGEPKVVGSDMVTFIPGPSLDGVDGHPLLSSARAIFSGAISGDKAAQATLRRGIRLAGLLTPADDQEDITPAEGEAILETLRQKVVGREHAGDVALINKRVKLQPWAPNNIELQWAETRSAVLGEVGRLFGVPPHLLNDIEKQTSWGTGVAEQNLGLARYTLMGWSTRMEQTLSRRLPAGQFVEFDYKGLLQGTPAQEIELLIMQKDAGILTDDEVRKILNLPPLTPAQKAQAALRGTPIVTDQAIAASASFASPAPVFHITTPEVRNEFSIPAPVVHNDVQPSPVSVVNDVHPAPVTNEVHVEPTPVTVTNEVTVDPTPVEVRNEVHVEPTPVTNEVHVEPTPVTVTNEIPAQRPVTKTIKRNGKGEIVRIVEASDGE